MRRGSWLLLVGEFGIWVVGDLLATVEQTLWHLTTFPVPSDAVYLGAYGLLAAGCLVMVRSRGAGRDMTALPATIAAGAAVVAAVFLIVPLAADVIWNVLVVVAGKVADRWTDQLHLASPQRRPLSA